MSLKELIRDVPDYPREGIVFKDITPLLADPDGLAEAIRRMADPFRQQNVELVTGAESRGFIFGAAIAADLCLGMTSLAGKYHGYWFVYVMGIGWIVSSFRAWMDF